MTIIVAWCCLSYLLHNVLGSLIKFNDQWITNKMYNLNSKGIENNKICPQKPPLFNKHRPARSWKTLITNISHLVLIWLLLLLKPVALFLDYCSFIWICDVLRDLAPFAQLKKREKHPWRSVTFSKVAGFSCNASIAGR